MWLIWQPIIINSQPGTKFVYAGVDWKADNLDNTMFWIGIFLVFCAGLSDWDQERRAQKKFEQWKNTER